MEQLLRCAILCARNITGGRAHASAAVVCAGVDLNLQQLYKVVQTHGGFEATISNKCWGKVATKLGIDKSAHTNASFVLK